MFYKIMNKSILKLLNRQSFIKSTNSPSHKSCVYAVKNYSTSSDNAGKYDLCIVGGGIVGMASAQELINRHPHLKYIVVEKEDKIAAHQSGHNSGVVHAGIYYLPGSLKAKLCVEGLRLSYKYFDEHKVPYKKCGKLIVATNPEEVERLDVIHERGLKNEVPDLRVLNAEQIKEVEPNCVGLKALHSPHTGIVDWGYVTEVYGEKFKGKGGEVRLNFEVQGFDESDDPDYPVVVSGRNVKSSERKEEMEQIKCKYVLACGGLYADKLALKSGCEKVPKIVPFRGEYLMVKKERTGIVNGNIYPVPDPKFPFLGVHFTPRMNGDVWLGPNAVLAFKREGYKLLDFNASELFDSLSFRGLRKLILSNLPYALGEFYRGINKRAQIDCLRKFVPSLQYDDVVRGPSGVRAQALDESGKLVDDFVFEQGRQGIGKRTLHVINAPSPAATSSLAIAKVVADKTKECFEF